jgi:hypothetical protein
MNFDRYTIIPRKLLTASFDSGAFVSFTVFTFSCGDLKDNITNEITMAFFSPTRPIVLRCEASFNEGLSAGLFQQTDKGLQPVHFTSRTMSDTITFSVPSFSFSGNGCLDKKSKGSASSFPGS